MSDLHVIVQLDRPRPLRYDGAAFAAFEQEFGKGIGPVILSLQHPMEKYSYRLIAHLLWAGLRHKDQTLTPARVTVLISQCEEQGITDLDRLWEQIEQALSQSGLMKLFTRKVADASGEDPTADPRTGAAGNHGPSPTSASEIG